MNTFKLVYGDYLWPEFNSRVFVTPFFVLSGNELTMAQAIRKGIVVKTDKSGGYKTIAQHMRILINTEIKGIAEEPINILISFRDTGGMVHAELFPQPIKDFAWESGYFFASDNVAIIKTRKDALAIYPEGMLRLLATITDTSLSLGASLCKVLNILKTKSRFAKS